MMVNSDFVMKPQRKFFLTFQRYVSCLLAAMLLISCGSSVVPTYRPADFQLDGGETSNVLPRIRVLRVSLDFISHPTVKAAFLKQIRATCSMAGIRVVTGTTPATAHVLELTGVKMQALSRSYRSRGAVSPYPYGLGRRFYTGAQVSGQFKLLDGKKVLLTSYFEGTEPPLTKFRKSILDKRYENQENAPYGDALQAQGGLLERLLAAFIYSYGPSVGAKALARKENGYLSSFVKGISTPRYADYATPKLAELVKHADDLIAENAINGLRRLGTTEAAVRLARVERYPPEDDRMDRTRLALRLLSEWKSNPEARLLSAYRLPEYHDDEISSGMLIARLWDFRHPRLVEPLIKFLENEQRRPVDEQQELLQKRTAAMLRSNTGQELGADAKAWRAWWKKNRAAYPMGKYN